MPLSRFGNRQASWLGETTDVARRLEHVLWIGGGSGAGKSTVARRLATEYGLQVYATVRQKHGADVAAALDGGSGALSGPLPRHDHG